MDFKEETREIFTGGFKRKLKRYLQVDFIDEIGEIFIGGIHRGNKRDIYSWNS